MVRPFKVVLLGITEDENLWQYSFLVFARNKKEATKLGVEATKRLYPKLKEIGSSKLESTKSQPCGQKSMVVGQKAQY